MPAGIYGITDDQLTPPEQLIEKVRAAIDGGISLLQYRSKATAPGPRRQQAEQLLQLCRSRQIPLIINDDVELCQAIHADGVHLGRSDGNCAKAREALGNQAIIGVTCHADIERAIDAERAGADYVAFGRFFPSETKPDASAADPDILVQARQQLNVPIVAIGGINAENGASLIARGATMLAVVNSLFAGEDVSSNAQRLVNLFDEG